MLKSKSLLILLLVLAALLLVFTGCGEPVEPDEHIGPDEEEEMNDEDEDEGYGGLIDCTMEVALS